MHKASEQIKGNLKKLCIYAQIVQAIQVYILNHVLKFTMHVWIMDRSITMNKSINWII